MDEHKTEADTSLRDALLTGSAFRAEVRSRWGPGLSQGLGALCAVADHGPRARQLLDFAQLDPLLVQTALIPFLDDEVVAVALDQALHAMVMGIEAEQVLAEQGMDHNTDFEYCVVDYGKVSSARSTHATLKRLMDEQPGYVASMARRGQAVTNLLTKFQLSSDQCASALNITAEAVQSVRTLRVVCEHLLWNPPLASRLFFVTLRKNRFAIDEPDAVALWKDLIAGGCSAVVKLGNFHRFHVALVEVSIQHSPLEVAVCEAVQWKADWRDLPEYWLPVFERDDVVAAFTADHCFLLGSTPALRFLLQHPRLLRRCIGETRLELFYASNNINEKIPTKAVKKQVLTDLFSHPAAVCELLDAGLFDELCSGVQQPALFSYWRHMMHATKCDENRWKALKSLLRTHGHKYLFSFWLLNCPEHQALELGFATQAKYLPALCAATRIRRHSTDLAKVVMQHHHPLAKHHYLPPTTGEFSTVELVVTDCGYDDADAVSTWLLQHLTPEEWVQDETARTMLQLPTVITSKVLVRMEGALQKRFAEVLIRHPHCHEHRARHFLFHGLVSRRKVMLKLMCGVRGKGRRVRQVVQEALAVFDPQHVICDIDAVEKDGDDG